MTTAAQPSTQAECLLCPPRKRRRVRDGGVSCWPCHDRLRDQLAECVERYVQLDPTPGRSGEGRRAPGFCSQPPLNLHVVAMRDLRTRTVELGDVASTLRVLGGWAQLVRRHRGQTPEPWASLTVVGEAGYLRDNLDWITRQPWARQLAAEVHAAWTQLRAATGEPNPRPVAFCIAQLDTGDECGHALFPPREGEELMRCEGCDSTYDPLGQVRLRLANEAGDPPVQRGRCRCGHLDAQHDNDSQARPCNSRWCSCTAYRPTKEAA